MKMNSRDLAAIYERLRIVQTGSSSLMLPAVLDSKRLLDAIDKNILITDFRIPDYIEIDDDRSLCFDWFRNNIEEKTVDILSLYFYGDGHFVFEGFIDSLGTHIKQRHEIKEELQEVFIIHLKHFN